MTKVFIDGSSGTTGLRIRDRLSLRKDIEMIILSDENRKDIDSRIEALKSADISFLCLPDDASREIVNLSKGGETVIIDSSTAHRTSPDFVYGFPELIGNEAIKSSGLITNPGCHASGFVALVYPLVREGLLAPNERLTCFSLTGYSGGGKKMISEYESEGRSQLLKGPRQYGLTQQHKHIKEMIYICGLENAPVFCPVVADFYSGMEVTVPVFNNMIKGSVDNIREVYKQYYTGPLVHFDEAADENGYMSASAFSGRDDMQISVQGNDERIILTARFDNLGKGASGSAIQNMNIVMGIDQTTGLVLGE